MRYLLIFLSLIFISGCTASKENMHSTFLPKQELNSKMRQLRIQLGQNSTALIYYERPEWKRFAHQIEHVIQGAQKKVESYLTINPGLYLEFILVNQTTFNRYITASNWVKAAFHKGRVFIPVDDKNPKDLNELAATITHEFSHAVIADLSNYNAPGWLDEGLATLIEGKDIYAATIRYLDWLRFNKPIDLLKLNAGFTHLDQEQASHAYIQSVMATKYLYEHYGKNKLQDLLKELKNGAKLKNAISKVYGLDLSQVSSESVTQSKVKTVFK